MEDDSLIARPYRLTVRYSMDRFEARLGLQKINFGQAIILRPLQWFDSIDPRDPLGFTTGVYGLLCRYFFTNNVNLWAWGLYGNRDRRGIDLFSPAKDHPEFGGRWQQPVPKGEMALSYHCRAVENHNGPVTEHRLALDGAWDIKLGVWFEACVSRLNIEDHFELWQEWLSVGSDYTFKNGIYVLTEHMLYGAGPAWDNIREPTHLTAVQATYRLGILDALNGIATCNWNSGQTHFSCGWLRTLDRWQMSGMGYVKSGEDFEDMARDKGVQIMVTYNH